MGLVQRVYDRQQRSRSEDQKQHDLLQAIRLASQECLKHGITSFQDAGSSRELVGVYRQLAEKGELPVRLWVMLSAGNDELARYLPECRLIGIGNHHLTVRAIKRLVDGALGSHGAWMLDPYEDLPSSRGLNTLPLDQLERTAELAIQNDFHLYLLRLNELQRPSSPMSVACGTLARNGSQPGNRFAPLSQTK